MSIFRSVEMSILFFYEVQDFWQLLPFPLQGHLDGVAFALTEDVGGVVLTDECGIEILAAEVVDELQLGLAFILDLARRDEPAEGVALLAQKAW